jgi:hypothetical protein
MAKGGGGFFSPASDLKSCGPVLYSTAAHPHKGRQQFKLNVNTAPLGIATTKDAISGETWLDIKLFVYIFENINFGGSFQDLWTEDVSDV